MRLDRPCCFFLVTLESIRMTYLPMYGTRLPSSCTDKSLGREVGQPAFRALRVNTWPLPSSSKKRRNTSTQSAIVKTCSTSSFRNSDTLASF